MCRTYPTRLGNSGSETEKRCQLHGASESQEAFQAFHEGNRGINGSYHKNKTQLAQAKEDLELLRKAWRKILAGGQEYATGPIKMQKARLDEIAEEISAYENAIDAYETNGTSKRRARRAIPLG